jgi:hypothetical protein
MDYLGTIYTTGGPIVILPRDAVSRWDGDKDYYRVTHIPMEGSAIFTYDVNKDCTVGVVRHSSDENFHIYTDRRHVAILSEIYANEGHELEKQLPNLTPWVTNAPSIRLLSFGGTLAVFDASLPGRAIIRREVGCEYVAYGYDDPLKRNSTAIVDIEYGTWEYVEVKCKDKNIAFTGIVLRCVDDDKRVVE